MKKTKETVKGIEEVSINKLSLTPKIEKILINSGIETIKDVQSKSKEELLEIKNFGQKSYEELTEKMNKYLETNTKEEPKKAKVAPKKSTKTKAKTTKAKTTKAKTKKEDKEEVVEEIPEVKEEIPEDIPNTNEIEETTQIEENVENIEVTEQECIPQEVQEEIPEEAVEEEAVPEENVNELLEELVGKLDENYVRENEQPVEDYSIENDPKEQLEKKILELREKYKIASQINNEYIKIIQERQEEIRRLKDTKGLTREEVLNLIETHKEVLDEIGELDNLNRLV